MPNQSGLQEFNEILAESFKSVDSILGNEDKGWVQLGTSATTGLFPLLEKSDLIRRSRYYSQIDPMATQALRLWTDYSFGTGLTWKSKDEQVNKIMEAFWYNHDNSACLSCAGQRKSSHNLLRDGSIYFAIFVGTGEDAKLRRIDPLEITEAICDPEDADTVLFFHRQWVDSNSKSHDDYYRSWQNIKKRGELVTNSAGQVVQQTQEAIIYRLERDPNGLPLLLPCIDWIKLHRQFLSSRAAIMLALARFAWKNKVKGGTAAINANKAKVQDQDQPPAGGWIFENDGSDTQPIRTDTAAGNAKTDGDMIKLMIAAACGIPLQYFGDVSVGQYATSKTVELPMIKMFESYQSVWEDTYNDICDIIFDAAGFGKDHSAVDWEFPAIMPSDAAGIAQNIASLIPALPELGYSDDVLSQALMSIGVRDINEAIEQLTALAAEEDARKAEEEKAQQDEMNKAIASGQKVKPAVWAREGARNNNVKLAKALKELQRILPKE